MDAQIFDVKVTPQERWTVLPLFFAADLKIQGLAQGRCWRRAMSALGLDPIQATLLEHVDVRGRGAVSRELTQSREPRLHRLTIGVVEYVVTEIGARPRRPQDEYILGDLFDRLEEIWRMKEGPNLSGVLAAYDPDEEDWSPPAGPVGAPVQIVTCPRCQTEFAADEERESA